jgi:hypothetical protein
MAVFSAFAHFEPASLAEERATTPSNRPRIRWHGACEWIGMKRFIHRLFLALPLAVALDARPSQADFYALDGRFECLNQPQAVCYDARPSHAAASPAAQAEAQEMASLPKQPAPAALAATNLAAPRNGRPLDPILEIASRIKAKRPAGDDLAVLRRAAAADDPRAIELLAWCALRGIGTSRDPVAAYFFYGEAAASAVPHARENQEAVYMQSLTPEERQRVLEIEALPRSARFLPDLLAADARARISADRP